MSQPQMTDSQRRKLEALLLVAYGALYRQALARAYTQLGVATEPAISADAQAWLKEAATQRATDAQNGINTRIEQALMADGEPVSADDAHAIIVTLQMSIETYNTQKLIPNMTSQINHQAQQDAYSSTATADGQRAIDATQWVWEQWTDNVDDCTAAADASPAAYDELVSIAGSIPPVHANCACSLNPA